MIGDSEAKIVRTLSNAANWKVDYFVTGLLSSMLHLQTRESGISTRRLQKTKQHGQAREQRSLTPVIRLLNSE